MVEMGIDLTRRRWHAGGPAGQPCPRATQSTLACESLRVLGKSTMPAELPILELVVKNYKNFNARATRDALCAYWRHIERG
ncbi:MAG TPA: hypothetical protein VH374_23275, partial [Polyangia bacterium]|nr:hypothetical protein [Polyangia bacterium]